MVRSDPMIKSSDTEAVGCFHLGDAIIKGTTDAGVARSVYARYVGS
jgi:hypothetical protein